MDEGYIKFNCEWIESNLDSDIKEINEWRDKLYRLKLIGCYDNGIGYGNISVRTKNGFLITGSATGSFSRLTKEHYSEVIVYDFDRNYVKCRGKIKASSESLSHAAVYESNPEIKAVVHVHSQELWNKLLNKVPMTSKDVKYGTPEMAYEIMRLMKIREENILVMAGHEDGVIAYGKNLNEGGHIILKHLKI